MRALSAAELLAVWERGIAAKPVERAIALLVAACPEMSPESAAKLSIGRRDRCLLALRERTFGPRLISVDVCPACHERLELAFDVADMRPEAMRPETMRDEAAQNEAAQYSVEASALETPETLTLCADGYEVHFRLPNSLDLAALAECENVSAGRPLLLERCVAAISFDGRHKTVSELPAPVATAIGERMAKADPGADLQLHLCCPACNYRWQATFDIVSFFWDEINAWAQRMLSEVHVLASAYGWPEADILEMHPVRRRFYLERLSP